MYSFFSYQILIFSNQCSSILCNLSTQKTQFKCTNKSLNCVYIDLKKQNKTQVTPPGRCKFHFWYIKLFTCIYWSWQKTKTFLSSTWLNIPFLIILNCELVASLTNTDCILFLPLIFLSLSLTLESVYKRLRAFLHYIGSFPHD